MKCPNCGSELRKGLSFCPQCGVVVSKTNQGTSSIQNILSSFPSDKKIAWKIVFWIFLFPIALTLSIIKNEKIKPAVKIAIIVSVWIIIFAIGASNSSETSQSNNNNNNINNNASSITDEESSGGEISGDDSDSIEDTIDVGVKYHSNEHINRLLTDYNKIAEYSITPEMVQNGAYSFKANISCNGVWISISATSNNGIFVDYSDEAASDEAVYAIFRDFCKALNPEITDDDVNSTWEILETEKYQNYNPYTFKGIECTYSESLLSNGEHRYTVKTNCKSYC